MKQHAWLLALLLCISCGKVRPVTELPDIVVGEPSFFPTIVAHTDAPILGGNRIDILLNGDETFPAMLREIKNARETITFAQYLYEDGAIAHEFARAFAERCRAGVKGHILLDSQGARPIPEAIPRLLREAGCKVEFFRKVEAPQVVLIWRLLRYNYRNHRRILVIDGKVGFTGGYGISEAWSGNGRTPEHWRETNARIEGPLVNQLQAAFVGSWFEATGALLGGIGYFPSLEPRGDVSAQIVKSSPVGGSFENYMLFLLSIASAKQSISITNPYFIPDDKIVAALLAAAARGVRITVLVPGKIDVKLTHQASRRNYGKMLQGGIEIYEYQPALMHAKTMIVDGIWATVGSTNMDNRSFALNEELNLAVYDRKFARRLEDIYKEDLRYSKKITYAAWAARPWRERFFEFFAFPLQEQL
ncbi:MAG TPA: cardiolipin synthase [Verrucomicrobiae bacterium]|nr:cardiolipin synthase [Verrucomicrobiae bacterium]